MEKPETKRLLIDQGVNPWVISMLLVCEIATIKGLCQWIGRTCGITDWPRSGHTWVMIIHQDSQSHKADFSPYLKQLVNSWTGMVNQSLLHHLTAFMRTSAGSTNLLQEGALCMDSDKQDHQPWWTRLHQWQTMVSSSHMEQGFEVIDQTEGAWVWRQTGKWSMNGLSRKLTAKVGPAL